jgi:hypothetical protein
VRIRTNILSKFVLALAAGGALSAVQPVVAQAARAKIDGVAVRFSAPELGGSKHPAFIFERELLFEAYLIAHHDPNFAGPGALPTSNHLNDALEHHIAERLLSSLPILPKPTDAEVENQAQAAREQILGEIGEDRFYGYVNQCQLGSTVVSRFFRRKALASLYLDRMVTPMLTPSRVHLYELHQAGKTPFSEAPFDIVENELRRWFFRRELADSIAAFYQSARPRLNVELVNSPLDSH